MTTIADSIHNIWLSVRGFPRSWVAKIALSWLRRCFNAMLVLGGMRNLIFRSMNAESEMSCTGLISGCQLAGLAERAHLEVTLATEQDHSYIVYRASFPRV